MDNKKFINDYWNSMETFNWKKLSYILQKYNNFKLNEIENNKFIKKLNKWFGENNTSQNGNKILIWMIKNNFKIKNNLFNLCIQTTILLNFFHKYTEGTNAKKYIMSKHKNKKFYTYISLISFCKTYNCFNDYCKIMESYLKKNLINYNIFESKNLELPNIESDIEKI